MPLRAATAAPAWLRSSQPCLGADEAGAASGTKTEVAASADPSPLLVRRRRRQPAATDELTNDLQLSLVITAPR
jgi:hypothetical protein